MELCIEYENILIAHDEILEIISNSLSHNIAMHIFYNYAGGRLCIPVSPEEGQILVSDIGLENTINLTEAVGYSDVEIKSQTYLLNKLKAWQLFDEYTREGKAARGKKGKIANLLGISTRSVLRYRKQYLAYKRQKPTAYLPLNTNVI